MSQDAVEPTVTTQRTPLSRRRWVAWGLAAAGAACLVDAVFVEPYWVELVERDLPIEHLPADLEGKTLVQLSDLHVGPRVSESYLLQSFARVEQLRPELVVITGDFVTSYGLIPEQAQVERVLAKLPTGQLGTFGIFGNHDYGTGWNRGILQNQLGLLLTDLGVTMLVNQVRDVQGLQIAGVDDLWRGKCNLGGTLRQTSADRARLVLCHNPDGADLPGWGDYRGWILSGHTHGGQCKPPFLPAPLVPITNRRYIAGEVALSDGRRLYINRGLGHLLPVRFNCRPEVTVFRLRRAEEPVMA